MGKKLKEQWPVLMVAAFLAIVGSVTGSWIINRNDTVNNSASVEYVDEEVGKACTQSINRDKALERAVNRKADKDDMEEVIKTLKIMDDRIYDLWKENYK